MSIESWGFCSKLWAVVRTEADTRVIAAVCDDEAVAAAVAMTTDESGGMLVDEATVVPCLLNNGEVVIANHIDVKTHEQLYKLSLREKVEARWGPIVLGSMVDRATVSELEMLVAQFEETDRLKAEIAAKRF